MSKAILSFIAVLSITLAVFASNRSSPSDGTTPAGAVEAGSLIRVGAATLPPQGVAPLECTTAELNVTDRPGGQWLYSIPVTFDRDYDFGQVDLQGMPPIYIDDVVYHSKLPDAKHSSSADSLTYADFSKWETGKSLLIAYSTETGAVLLDPTTGKYIEIVYGLENHPIELIYIEKVGEGSTASEVVAANEVIEIWAAEIARIYGRLRLEFPEQVAVFNEAEQQWEAYCRADQNARRVAFDKEGSIYSITAAHDRVALYRNHALRIARWGRY